jgi:hypothetical protein
MSLLGNLKLYISQASWHTPVISALGRLKQKDQKFKAGIGYVVSPCLKKQNS